MNEQFQKVQETYNQLVQASDDLAEAMGLDKDRTLARIMPGSQEQRRDSARLSLWFEKHRENAEKRMAKAIKEKAKAEILSKLNLNEEEKAILLG